MNPELLRNIWQELTERRITLMVVVLGAILLLAMTSGSLASAVSTAEISFYAVVVVWGTRCAAQSVVEEIAGKTWDAQRLSAIRPWTMVWGSVGHRRTGVRGPTCTGIEMVAVSTSGSVSEGASITSRTTAPGPT